jgi:hypothetical protein
MSSLHVSVLAYGALAAFLRLGVPAWNEPAPRP